MAFAPIFGRCPAAGSWPELLAVHDPWVADDNDQDHVAYQKRPEDRRSPAAVLHRVRGKFVAPAELHRNFSGTRFGRVLEGAGDARFRRWQVSAERGLGGEPVAVWWYAEHLTLVSQDEPLAQYRVADQSDQRRLQRVTPEELFETPHRAPQPPLRTWGRTSGYRCRGCQPLRRASRARLARCNRPASPSRR